MGPMEAGPVPWRHENAVRRNSERFADRAPMRRTNTARRPRSLTAVLSLAFVAISVISLCLAGGLQLAASLRTRREVFTSSLRLVASDASRTVSAFIEARYRALETAVWFADPAQKPPAEKGLFLESLMGLDDSFRGLLLLDERDRVSAEVSRQSFHIAEKIVTRIESAVYSRVRSGERAISQIYIDESTGEPLVIAAIPVTDALGDYRGMLAAEVNLKSMWELVGGLKVGNTGRAYVVDRTGRLLAYGDAARVLRNERVGNVEAVQRFMQSSSPPSESEVLTYRGIAGTTVLGAYVPLGTPDWAVVTELPTREAYRQVSNDILVSGLITLCMTVFAALTGALVSRRLTIPLVELTGTADRISRGETSLRASLRGPREVTHLAAAFNSMTSRLGQAMEDLERAVVGRTRELQDALAFQQEVFKASSTGITVYDPTGKCVMANEASAGMIGAPIERLLESNYHEISAWRESGLYEAACRALASEKETKVEAHFTTSFDREVWLSCRFVPFISAGAQHLLLTIEDMSERVRTEAEIRGLNGALETHAENLAAANKELEAFSYSVSHDLRAPLRAIDGYARILAEDYGPSLDAEGRRVCGVVRNETQRMTELIEDLLTLSRLGRRELRMETIDMEALARSVFDELADNDAGKKVEFAVDPLPRAAGDAGLMRQVWSNLISNALKFSSRVERPAIRVTGAVDGESLVYSIRDNGAGFNMRFVDKLFGVFQRLHNEREFIGTGVGLAIVQRIIRRHGGRVWAKGIEGEGATFSFILPGRP